MEAQDERSRLAPVVEPTPGPTHAPAAGDPLAGLLRAAADGDRAAFERLYRATGTRAYAVAFRLLRRAELAEEAVQEAYVEIWRKARSFDPARGAVMAWIAGIVRFRAIDLLRRLQRLGEIEAGEVIDALPDPAPLASDLVVEVETAGRLAYCLAMLRQDQQHAIRLAYFDGLTYEQVSDKLGAPLGTTKSRIRRGLHQLKRCLDGEGSGTP